jgi:non-specific serine/threonine protein kinase
MERQLARASEPRYRLYLFGTFRLEALRRNSHDAQPWRVIHLPRRKVEALLAYLVLHPQAHTREHLATLFWGDSPDAQARTSLRTSLAVLRKYLGDDLLNADRETIQLNPHYPIWVDAQEFSISDFRFQLAEISESKIENLKSKLELYQGELLAEFYDDWVLNARERYRAWYLEALLALTQHARAQSDYERAIASVQPVLVVDAANERAHQHLMFCYAASGNRQAALAQYAQCVEALRVELGVEPSPETQALYHWIKQTPTTAPALAARITNLPIPLTSFIGRKHELTELKMLLSRDDATNRLYTLTGAGGSGKTRLSIQVATDLLDAFKDGVWWVELAALTEAALVLQTIAKTLDVSERPSQPLAETLTDYLQSKQVLLVLDNCEHLIAACAQWVEFLLSHCPHLKILATSREALGITGETIIPVPTLPVPPAPAESLTQLLLAYEGIRLFVERARAVQTDFALTEQNAAAVAHIVRRLDGIPLALELAAARVKVLSITEIAARLDDRFSLLTSGSRTALPRQQTLRALIDWSYELLTPLECALFSRLSIFIGGFTLEAVEYVVQGLTSHAQCEGVDGTVGGKHSSLDLLMRLVDKSLVIAEQHDSATRYRLLDTIRAYAREWLSVLSDAEVARLSHRHLVYFTQFAQQAQRELESTRQTQWLARLEQEHDNLRAALGWARTAHRCEQGLRLVAALWRFWKVHGHYREAREWYDSFLALDEQHADASTPTARAWAQYAAGMLAYHQSDFQRAAQLHEQSLAVRRSLRDEAAIAESLAGLGLAARALGDYARATALFEESLALARTLNAASLVSECLRYLGLVAIAQGEAERAMTLFEQALPLSRALGDEEAYANVLSNLATALAYRGELERAERLTEEGLVIRRRLNDPHGLALSLHTLSFFARQRAQWQRAKELLCEALRLYVRLGTKENTIECVESIAYVQSQRGHPTHAARLYSAGQALREALHIPLQAYHQSEQNAEVAAVRTVGGSSIRGSVARGARADAGASD